MRCILCGVEVRKLEMCVKPGRSGTRSPGKTRTQMSMESTDDVFCESCLYDWSFTELLQC